MIGRTVSHYKILEKSEIAGGEELNCPVINFKGGENVFTDRTGKI